MSILLTSEECVTLNSMIERKCQNVCAGVVKMYMSDPDFDHRRWKLLQTGVVCFIKDYNRRSYYIQAFLAISALLAVAFADQSSHQTIQHGHAAPVHTSVHKPHAHSAAAVVSQPHAAPHDVHNPYAPAKPISAVHAPSHIPVHAAPYHPAPVAHHAAPYLPAPVHHAAPYHPAPYHPSPAPYHPAPAPYHPSPAPYHAPAHKHVSPYHEESYDGPAVYNYGYAIADDYSGANFAQNESRDGYATKGEYRVNLPDGRTQIVTYSVGDAYSGYVADVKYEGVPHYDAHKPVHKAVPHYA